jgi:hypothetical protein
MYGDENQAAIIREKIRKAWYDKNKKSQIKGSNYHDDREQRDHFNGEIVNPWTGELQRVKTCTQWISEGVKTNTVDIGNLPDGYYTELIVMSDFLIGQIDRLWIDGKTFYISDYKTNEKLDFENRYQKMLGPCRHLDDCNWNHYIIQLGVYCWILERLGYTFGGANIVHCILDEKTKKWKEKVYDVPYNKTLLNDIISVLWFDKMMP